MTELYVVHLYLLLKMIYLNPLSDFNASVYYESRYVLCVLEALHAGILLSKSLYIEF